MNISNKNMLQLFTVAIILMSFISKSNAALISGSDVVGINTVSYQVFEIGTTGDVDFSLIGTQNGDVNTNWINYYIFNGQSMPFGDIEDFSEGQSSLSHNFTLNLGVGLYTWAIGPNFLSEQEARSGTASTPAFPMDYIFSIDGDGVVATGTVPEPSVLAIMSIGLIGMFRSKRRKVVQNQ